MRFASQSTFPKFTAPFIRCISPWGYGWTLTWRHVHLVTPHFFRWHVCGSKKRHVKAFLKCRSNSESLQMQWYTKVRFWENADLQTRSRWFGIKWTNEPFRGNWPKWCITRRGTGTRVVHFLQNLWGPELSVGVSWNLKDVIYFYFFPQNETGSQHVVTHKERGNF